MAPDTTQFLAHRLTMGRTVAWLVAFGSLVGLLDILRSGRLGSYGSAACLLLATAVGAYVLGLRPAVLEGPAGVEVRNPLRTTVVPWQALTGVDVADVLRLQAGEQQVRCFAVPRRRPPVTAVRSAMSTGFMLPPTTAGGGWAPPAGQPRAQALAERLREMSVRYGNRQGPAGAEPAAADAGPAAPALVVRWAPDALVALVVIAALVAAALVIR